jgi:hypothetical protein
MGPLRSGQVREAVFASLTCYQGGASIVVCEIDAATTTHGTLLGWGKFRYVPVLLAVFLRRVGYSVASRANVKGVAVRCYRGPLALEIAVAAPFLTTHKAHHPLTHKWNRHFNLQVDWTKRTFLQAGSFAPR